MSRSGTVRLLTTSVAFIAIASPSFAIDGQDLLDKFNAAYGGTGVMKAASIEEDGDNLVLKGLSYDTPGPNPNNFPLGDLTLQEVTEWDDGSYRIERIDFNDLNIEHQGTKVSASDLYVSGIHIPNDTKGGDIWDLMIYEEAHSGPIDINVGGKSMFSIREASGSMEISEDEESMAFEGGITGIKGDLSTVSDPKAKDAISKLQLTTIDGNVTMKGGWDLSNGALTVDEYKFDFADIGSLNIAASINGYTLALVEQLRQAAAGVDPANEQARQMASLVMFGLLQQISIASASISFVDAGISERGAAYAGEQQGKSAAEMKEMAKATVPFVLMSYGLGSLQTQVATAVNAFIDAPKNITISAKPAAPVPVPQIAQAAQTSPEAVVKLLGVTVTSND